MSDWLLNLPVFWMALLVFIGTYLFAAAILFVVTRLAVNDRAKAFKALSPGMLPPLGILFALLIGFTAAQVWSDFDKAKLSVATEASALRAVVLLSQNLPPEQDADFAPLSASISMSPSIKNGRQWRTSAPISPPSPPI